jgi:hypothetical protein
MRYYCSAYRLHAVAAYGKVFHMLMRSKHVHVQPGTTAAAARPVIDAVPRFSPEDHYVAFMFLSNRVIKNL